MNRAWYQTGFQLSASAAVRQCVTLGSDKAKIEKRVNRANERPALTEKHVTFASRRLSKRPLALTCGELYSTETQPNPTAATELNQQLHLTNNTTQIHRCATGTQSLTALAGQKNEKPKTAIQPFELNAAPSELDTHIQLLIPIFTLPLHLTEKDCNTAAVTRQSQILAVHNHDLHSKQHSIFTNTTKQQPSHK